jgi:glucose/arabinose dehydrogenase
MRYLALLTAASLIPLGACSTGNGAATPASASLRAGSTTSGPASAPRTSTPASSASTPPAPSSASRSAAHSPATALPSAPVTVASRLQVPWGLGFLPDGSALVTLRDQGTVLRVRDNGTAPVLVGKVPGVEPLGEAGLLGVAVSPRFASDHSVFVYLTSATDNRVMRMTLEGNTLRAGPVILDRIPKANHHDGGRLAFGPDGYLYVSTGDAGNRPAAQDRSSLGGKILRVTTDGRPAPGNPFPGSRVWTLGHRNVQGMAWDSAGRMYASEFGQDTWDELNLIRPGSNYGWPTVEGRAGRAGFTDPLVQWPTDEASPSGIAVGRDGDVYLAALQGRCLWEVPVPGGTAGTPRKLLAGTYGRLRTVATGPDGRLWVITSNTFRGRPTADDDRVVILPPSVG